MKTEGKLQNRGNGKIINNHQHTGISSRRTWYFVFHPSPVLHLTFSKGKHWDFLGPLCDTYLNMPKNNNDCSEKLVKQGGLVVGDKLGRRRRKVPRQVALGLLSAGLYYVFLAGYASADRISPSDARLQRAGNIAGLEEGRISLERLTRMMSTSVHVEVSYISPYSAFRHSYKEPSTTFYALLFCFGFRVQGPIGTITKSM